MLFECLAAEILLKLVEKLIYAGLFLRNFDWKKAKKKMV